MVKIGSIVKKIATNEVYEVERISGTMLICKAISVASLKEAEHGVPLFESEVEVVIDGETDAFNILFGDNDD